MQKQVYRLVITASTQRRSQQSGRLNIYVGLMHDKAMRAKMTGEITPSSVTFAALFSERFRIS